MSASAWDVVVIGSGPAGQKAAICAAKAGKRVLVVEREVGVGGACVHRGTIPSKTLRETALALSSFQRRSGHVIDVHMPETMQIASILSRLGEVVVAHERLIEDQLTRNGVARWHGRARFLAPGEIEVTTTHSYARRARAPLVVVATGSHPRTPQDVPIDHEHILDSDSILSMAYLPKSLTVLGSGVIACEYASVFTALGTQVTMIDRADRPLGFLDVEVVQRFLESFERAGGCFLPRARVRRVEYDGVCSVVTELESGERIESEKMLCAQGRVANVEGLGLEAAGLTLGEAGFIPVDDHCRTHVPGIYAVGDVIGPPSLASTSMEQGRRAMCHALGVPVGGSTGDLVPIGVYTIPEISQVGLTEEQARARHGSVSVGRARFDELARGQIASAKHGLLKLVADAEGRRLLGVQIVGEGAAELAHVGQMAMLGGLCVEAFVENTFNFPTFAEAYRVAALDLADRRHAGGDESATIAIPRKRCA